jgi:hypothetical protein
MGNYLIYGLTFTMRERHTKMLNYYYDRESGLYELYFGDALIMELPYADPMTEEEAYKLSQELFTQYCEANHE